MRSCGPLRVARPSVKPAPATGSVLVAPGDLRGDWLQRLGRQMAGETCAAKKRGAVGVCAVAGLGSERSIQVGSPKGWWAQGRALRTRWYRQLAVRCSGCARIVIVYDLGQEKCAQLIFRMREAFGPLRLVSRSKLGWPIAGGLWAADRARTT